MITYELVNLVAKVTDHTPDALQIHTHIDSTVYTMSLQQSPGCFTMCLLPREHGVGTTTGVLKQAAFYSIYYN